MKTIYFLLLFAAIVSVLTSPRPLDNFSQAILSTFSSLSQAQAKAQAHSPWKFSDQVLIGYDK